MSKLPLRYCALGAVVAALPSFPPGPVERTRVVDPDPARTLSPGFWWWRDGPDWTVVEVRDRHVLFIGTDDEWDMVEVFEKDWRAGYYDMRPVRGP